MCYDMRKMPNYFYLPVKLRSWFKHFANIDNKRRRRLNRDISFIYQSQWDSRGLGERQKDKTRHTPGKFSAETLKCLRSAYQFETKTRSANIFPW